MKSVDRRASTAALGVLAAFAVVAAPARGQDEPGQARRPAALVGKVFNASTGAPVEGAVVNLIGSGVGALTDSTGAFRIPQTWAGRDSIEVRFIGYTPSGLSVDLVPDETTEITLLLSATVVRVADLTVQVRQTRRARNLEGFVRRMERGFGQFFTPKDIRNRNPRLPSDLLRGVPGVTVGRIEYGRAEVYLGSGERLRCPPAIYLDGVYQAGMQLDDIPPEDLGAVELYRRETETPVEFMRSRSTCGAIVIWTPDGPDFWDWDGELPDPY